MSIQDIVDVQITRETTAVSQLGFGTFMILGEHTVFPERIRFYQTADSILDDGFLATDPEYIAASSALSQNPRPVRVAIGRIDAGDASLTDSLNAVSQENDDWYGFAITSRLQADVEEAAAWTEAEIKIFGSASDDVEILNASSTTDIGAVLQAAGYARTFVMYHDEAATAYPEAAWFGVQLPTAPGSSTWAFKTLAGIPVVDMSSTQRTNAFNKNVNTYELRGGVNITKDGQVSSGEYIDIIRGVDWLQARMTERVYLLLTNSPKIPYTDAGVGIVEAEVRAQLDAAIAQGVIAIDPAYTVTVPLVKNISTNDKANRFLPDVRFEGTLQGAIHSIRIRGIVRI